MKTNQDENTPGKIQAIGSTRLEGAVEGLIFATEEPISPFLLAQTYAEATGEDQPTELEIVDTIERLNRTYERTSRAFKIEKWGNGYRFATLPAVAPFIKALFVTDRQRKLTRTLMESLAILSYKQPASRAELEFVRGVDCDYALRKLMEYGLIDVVGRAETVGRPLLYGTTQRFLELFGLPSISDLPNLREMESILDDPAFQKEKARMLVTSTVQLPLNVDGTGGKDDQLGVELETDEESKD